MKATATTWEAVPLEQLNPLMTRRYVHGERIMVTSMVLEAGAVVPWHSHHNEQLAVIQEGALHFEFGAEGAVTQTETVRGGGVVVIPGNLPHRVKVLERTLLLDIFSPPRQDWIDGTDAYLREGNG